MNTKKILKLFAILTFGLNCVSTCISAMKQENPTNNKAILNDLPDDIIYQILSLTPSYCSTSQVCKKFRDINNKVLKDKWHFLQDVPDKYFLSHAMLQMSNLKSKQDIDYNKFYKLFWMLGSKLGLHKKSLECLDATNTEFYIHLDKLIQIDQDNLLEKLWPRIRQAIEHQTTGYSPEANPNQMTKATEIRKYLMNSASKPIIQQITYLNFCGYRLTQLPQELSLFTNLEILDLRYNKLSHIEMPPELTSLQILHLANNRLTSANIPNELESLLLLDLQYNQLQKIKLSEGLINLKICLLNNNQLVSIKIPKDLISLRKLWLQNNKLKSLELPRTLASLKELGIYGNQLNPKESGIPDALKYQIRILTTFGTTQSLFEEGQSCTIC